MNIENVKRAVKLMEEAQDLMGGGPLEHHLTELSACYDLLINRYAPFKAGDIVVLTQTPEISESVNWGWMRGRDYLKEGARAVIKTVDCGSRGFQFGLIFDEDQEEPSGIYEFGETWIKLK